MQSYMPLLLFSYERVTKDLSPITLEILNLVGQNFRLIKFSALFRPELVLCLFVNLQPK